MSAGVAIPAFLERFSCLGADCEDTCCKGWNMQVEPRTQARYRECAPSLLYDVVGEPEAAVMRRDPQTDYCVRFEGLCGIQSRYGEDFLSDACFFYPRATRALGDAVSMTAALSCPEIVRLALLDQEGLSFDARPVQKERLPLPVTDYLPDGLTPDQAQTIHDAFLKTALDETLAPEQALMRLFSVASSLACIPQSAWPEAAPFYLQHAERSLPAPEPRPTDPAFLVQALCGLVSAAKYLHQTRLVRTIEEMQRALHIQIRWDTRAITALPDSVHATAALQARWRSEWKAHHDGLLRRYLAMQLSLALFPFAGFGAKLTERAAVIGIRFATVRLGLMGLLYATAGSPSPDEIVRVVQSLSRFLDHLSGSEFSLKIYGEAGWLQPGRLHGLLLNGADAA